MKPDDRVRARFKLFDRYAPRLRSVNPGEIGDVWDVGKDDRGVDKVTVGFGLCVVVCAPAMLEPEGAHELRLTTAPGPETLAVKET